MTRRTNIVLGTAGAAVALILGFGATAAIAGVPPIFAPWGVSAADGTETQPMPAPDYDINDSGQTFGTAAQAPAPELEPDLILVVSNEGPTGYVFKTALDEATGATAMSTFKSPDDALRWQEARQSAGPITIPVYRADGTTEIGTFTIGIPNGVMVPASEADQR